MGGPAGWDDKLHPVATSVGNRICTYVFMWNPCHCVFFKPLFIQRRLAERACSYSGTSCFTFMPYAHLHLRDAQCNHSPELFLHGAIGRWMHSCSSLFSSRRPGSVIFIIAYLNFKSTVVRILLFWLHNTSTVDLKSQLQSLKLGELPF